MPRCRTVLLLLTFLPSVAAARESPAQPAATDNRDIIVLGGGLILPPGTPAYGAVTIDRARLDGDASGRVEDVLADVAGFQQFRRSDSRSANPSAQGVTLRALGGNASSRALVLLDSVPIADPFFGSIPFNALSPDRLTAVRITRGGGAGAFGSGAVAGTIELISADRRDLPLIAGSAFEGSDDAQALTASLSPNIGSSFVSLSGRYERGDGFYTTPLAQRVPASVRARYRDYSGNVRAVVPIGALSELQLHGTLFRDNRTLRFKGADSSSRGEDGSIRFLHRGDWQVDALVYAQSRNFTNKVVSATTFRVTLDQRDTPSSGAGGKIELRLPVGPDHVLRIGGDVRVAHGRLFEDAYGPSAAVTARRTAGGDETTAGLFVEDDWTIERLVLTGGARIDRWSIANGFFQERNPVGALTINRYFADRLQTESTFRGGALFHLAPGVQLRAAAYSGYRLPTLNELYRPFVVFPVTTQANDALKPEKLRGAEVGLDLTPAGGVKFGLTAFTNRLEDAIANVTIGQNLRQRQNVNAIIAKGIEATFDARRGVFSINASYAYNHSKVSAPGVALNGKDPAQSPRQSVSATLVYWHKGAPMLSATLRHVGRQYEDDLQTDVLPAETTVDAVAILPLTRGLSVVARAENFFNETVYARNQAGSIDLGTPRTLWIGLRFGG
ncbi:MAG: TonB-dependent receptor [Sphingomonadaceae bacterium]|nr:TonB-dependent receptor [Sphingomonadaceae bacterium]